MANTDSYPMYLSNQTRTPQRIRIDENNIGSTLTYKSIVKSPMNPSLDKFSKAKKSM
jgi:hypothetical protein